MKRIICFFLSLGVATFALPVLATGEGRLLATGGASHLGGSAGGGLSPWAVLAGYGTESQPGGTVFITHVTSGDYTLNVIGGAYTWNNRVEFSFARQTLDLGTLGIALGAPDTVLRQNILGVKVRLLGSLVYGAMPQLSAGVQYKNNLDFAIPQAVGAQDDSGVDVYLSASKLYLAGFAGRNILLNGTLRATRANQLGLLGFGGDRNDDYEVMLEASAAIMLNPQTLVGIEYRQKPDNLSFAGEDDWADLFIAYFPNKQISFVAAYADMGSIAGLDHQTGVYLSVQASF